jgi:hypothetical protein
MRRLRDAEPNCVSASNMAAFMHFVNEHYGTAAKSFDELHAWSVAYPDLFW